MVRKHKQMFTPVKNTIISIYTAGDFKQSFCESVRNFYTIVLAYPENYSKFMSLLCSVFLPDIT